MKNRRMEFPHPVLCSDTNDFPEGDFGTQIIRMDDAGESIVIDIHYDIGSVDINDLIKSDMARALVRVTCPRTSYREIFTQDSPLDEVVVEIEKKNISDALEVCCYVIAKNDIDGYLPSERNKEYFGDVPARVKAGDILAIERGRTIKLDTEYEKEVSGVINVVRYSGDKVSVKYAAVDEEDAKFADYITILMPENMHDRYSKLRKRKLYKKNVERFLQASVIMPAIVEAIGLLRNEEEYERQETDPEYKGTLWGESIINALRRRGVEISEEIGKTNYELANSILNDVVGDSLNDLIKKMDDIDTSFMEDVQ